MKNVDKNIIVIGDGIVGSCLIYLLSRLGFDNVINVTSKHHKSSVNNQTWLQSGALYNTNDSKQADIAKLLAMHGQEFEETFNMQHHNRKGIVGVKSLKEANDKIEFLNNYGKNLAHIKTEEANYLLNDFYSKDLFYISVPDHPFNEIGILNTCRTIGENCGVKFIEVTDCSIIQKGNNLEIVLDSVTYEADIIFLAAGVGTKKIIEKLGLPVPINAYRSLLLNVPYDFSCGVEMFADQKRNVNFINASSLSNNKLYLLGNGMRSTSVDMYSDINIYKSIQMAEYNEFIDNLNGFPKIKEVLKSHCDLENINACFKVEHIVDNQPNYFPWTFSGKDLKNVNAKNTLIIGGAGKATLGLYTARKMLEKANIDSNVSSNGNFTYVNNSTHHRFWAYS